MGIGYGDGRGLGMILYGEVAASYGRVIWEEALGVGFFFF
jgi:hypothetical protein